MPIRRPGIMSLDCGFGTEVAFGSGGKGERVCVFVFFGHLLWLLWRSKLLSCKGVCAGAGLLFERITEAMNREKRIYSLRRSGKRLMCNILATVHMQSDVCGAGKRAHGC
jgi:hypothetical protein